MHDWLVVLGDEICCGRQHELQNAFATGVLPELDALASLLGANEEWEQDASAVRARMLNILLDIADRYQAFGAQPITQIPSVNSVISCSMSVECAIYHIVATQLCASQHLLC